MTHSLDSKCCAALQARGRPCDCSWPEFCDSQRGALPPTRLAALAQQATGPSAAAAQFDAAEDRSGDGCRPTGAHRDQAAVTPVHQQEAGPEREVHQREAAELEQAREKEPSQREAHLQRLEEQYVHNVYNAIAPHFSSTRFAVWPKVGGGLFRNADVRRTMSEGGLENTMAEADHSRTLLAPLL